MKNIILNKKLYLLIQFLEFQNEFGNKKSLQCSRFYRNYNIDRVILQFTK
jgi:hypothetical protein